MNAGPRGPLYPQGVPRIPHLGAVSEADGFPALSATSDGLFHVGRDGVSAILATPDRKVEFVAWGDRALAHVTSALGYPAYYPVLPVEPRRPVRAVLMDLDGTTVRSEDFWIWIIEQTTATLRGEPGFALEADDLPYVSGHSVSEHLQYCLTKYAPGASLVEARRHYFLHAHREMAEILAGRGRGGAFRPAPGLAAFLHEVKARRLPVGLVTSGLHEKAYPAIVAAFRTLGLGDPAAFFDVIITAGFPLRTGEPGTLGELSPKPHPWLYAEAFRVGLGLPFEARESVLGFEDSGAGVCAVRLAGLVTVGVGGGNVEQGGLRPLCHAFCPSLEEGLRLLDGA